MVLIVICIIYGSSGVWGKISGASRLFSELGVYTYAVVPQKGNLLASPFQNSFVKGVNGHSNENRVYQNADRFDTPYLLISSCPCHSNAYIFYRFHTDINHFCPALSLLLHPYSLVNRRRLYQEALPPVHA